MGLIEVHYYYILGIWEGGGGELDVQHAVVNVFFSSFNICWLGMSAAVSYFSSNSHFYSFAPTNVICIVQATSSKQLSIPVVVDPPSSVALRISKSCITVVIFSFLF